MAEDVNQRIEQWEKMTREVPDGMAFFSLGNAYREAGRYEDAATALGEALRHDENLSRGYQLLGQVLILLERQEEAGKVLTQGYTVAAGRGDVMPQRAMESLLEKLELPVPRVETPKPAAAPVGADSVIDRRTGQPGSRMAGPPMRGPLGTFIFDHFSQETWGAWIAQGTKVINELRLDFSDQEHQKVYDVQMMEWLGISQEEVDEHAKKAGEK
jgi:Fe-S cluster biosynthesis and repair protein YggX